MATYYAFAYVHESCMYAWHIIYAIYIYTHKWLSRKIRLVGSLSAGHIRDIQREVSRKCLSNSRLARLCARVCVDVCSSTVDRNSNSLAIISLSKFETYLSPSHPFSPRPPRSGECFFFLLPSLYRDASDRKKYGGCITFTSRPLRVPPVNRLWCANASERAAQRKQFAIDSTGIVKGQPYESHTDALLSCSKADKRKTNKAKRSCVNRRCPVRGFAPLLFPCRSPIHSSAHTGMYRVFLPGARTKIPFSYITRVVARLK